MDQAIEDVQKKLLDEKARRKKKYTSRNGKHAFADPYPMVRFPRSAEFGVGQWYWQHSLEMDDPKGPFAQLEVSQQWLLGKMAGIVRLTKDWVIRLPLTEFESYLQGKLKRRAMWTHLQELLDNCFMDLLFVNKDWGNVYVLSSRIMAASEQPQSFAHYDLASKLVIKNPAKKIVPAHVPMTPEESRLYVRYFRYAEALGIDCDPALWLKQYRAGQIPAGSLPPATA